MSTSVGDQLGFAFGTARSKAVSGFWTYIDRADLGGRELRARRGLDISAVLAVEQLESGEWIGTHDLLLRRSGTNGESRPQRHRGDALLSAANGIYDHCRAIVTRPGEHPQVVVRAAREINRWLRELDVL